MYRFLFAFPVALFISYGLIVIMAWMVDLNTQDLKSDRQPLQFDIFTADNQESSRRKSRLLPDPPQLKPQPPQPPEIQPQLKTSSVNPTLESIPELKMDLAVSGIAISVPIPVSNQPDETPVPSVPQLAVNPGHNQQVMPLHRIEPVYPRKALQRKIEGYVVLSFDINESGRPENIKVEEEKPPRVFSHEAMKALKRWKYQPMVINGKAQVHTAQRVKLEFKIR